MDFSGIVASGEHQHSMFSNIDNLLVYQIQTRTKLFLHTCYCITATLAWTLDNLIETHNTSVLTNRTLFPRNLIKWVTFVLHVAANFVLKMFECICYRCIVSFLSRILQSFACALQSYIFWNFSTIIETI